MDMNTIKEMSYEEIDFIKSGIMGKTCEIITHYICNEQFQNIPHEDIPKHIKSFNKSAYTNHLGQLQSPVIISRKIKLRNLEIMIYDYETDKLRDEDHMSRDYGCYGQFNEYSVFYNGKESFRVDNSCSCHSNGPSMKLEKDKNFTKISIFNINEEIKDRIEKEYNKVIRLEKIKELEEKSGMNLSQIRKLLGRTPR